MPFPGGDADKVGNRYEALWTVRCLLKILNEDADSVLIEQIGEQWEGIEFSLKLPESTEYHQVKRQNGSKGHWPLATLASSKVLENAKNILRVNSDSSFVFISTDKIANLPELVSRAKSCQNDYQQFINEAIKTNEHFKAFNKLHEYLNLPDKSEIFIFLKKFDTKTIGETELLELIKTQASRLIKDDPLITISLLRIYCENNLQTEITAHTIWTYLKSHNLAPVDWNQDKNVHIAIERCNSRYSQENSQSLINHTEILRHEITDKLCTAIQNDKKIITVIGRAGSGKSIVMQQAFRNLVNRGVILLGFRIDRLEPESTPKGIGRVLDLPESPAYVLAQKALGKPCVLFIDQLDAVSLTSGRNPNFFACIDELFRQTNQYKNMKLIIGCREFDLKNDHRFRSFMLPEKTKKIVVNYLSQDEVKEQLGTAKLSVGRLNMRQLSLLAQPLFLSVFIQATSNEEAYKFNNIGDLFRLQTKHIRQDFRGNQHKIHWTAIMRLLSNYMNQHQVLSVPERVLDEYEEEAQIIMSSGILIYEKCRYSFFHESFFDYIFANHFLNQAETMSEFLLSKEQHLFRRAQVRQILTLQREDNFSQYLRDIEVLLNHPNIRLHIKMSILSWLGQLEEPKQEEQDILLAIANSKDNSLKNYLWREITGQVAWFNLLDQTGIINHWLSSNDEVLINPAINFLSAVQYSKSDRVVDIIKPLYENNKKEQKFSRVYLTQLSSLGNGRKYFDFFLQLLKDGMLDDTNFWNLLFSLKKKRPEWIGNLLVVWVKRQLILKPLKKDSLYSLPKSHLEIIQAGGEKSSLEFFQDFFPLLEELIKKTVQKNKGSKCCIIDSFWGPYLNHSFKHHTHTYILYSMKIAIELIAENKPEYFQKFFNTWKNTPYRTIQHLVISGLIKSGEEFSDRSIDYLIKNNCHLNLGTSYGWLSRQLIEAATPYCSDTKLKVLEGKLLNFYGNSISYYNYNNKKEINTYFGYDQFTLLTGIYKSRQNKKIQLRIMEWQRKFLIDNPVKYDNKIIGGYVRSPVSRKAIKYMNNQQWLQAINKYDSDKHIPDNHLKGGVMQLSKDLEECTAKKPERFAKLYLKFHKNTNIDYYDAILNGLSTRNDGSTKLIGVDLIFSCCQKAFNMKNKPCGYSISRLISTYKKSNLPTEMCDMLLWYASSDPNPDKNLTDYSSNESIVDDLTINAINSIRGKAVGAIAELIFENEQYYRYYKPYLTKLCQREKNIAVRSEIAYIVIAVSKYDKNEALDLFDSLVSNQLDELFVGRWVEKYINYTIFDDFKRIIPYIRQMLNSELSDVKQAGARQACIAGLVTEGNEVLIQKCLQGDLHHRKGATDIFMDTITSELYSKQSKEALSTLFNDAEKEVRDAAARCFYKIKEKNLTPYKNFIESFIDSHAIEDNTSTLERLLQKSLTKLPDTILLLIEQFIDKQGVESGDTSTSAAGDSYQISKLLIRLYSQTNSNEIKTRCLDAIDNMIGFGSNGLGNELAQFER